MVVAGGDRPASVPLVVQDAGAWVIAVDHGIDHARALGLPIHQAIGDFDSVSAAGLATVRASGAIIEEHPAMKDATDLELAMDAAAAHKPERVLVLGAHGGRLDHAFGNMLLLAAPQYAEIDVTAFMGDAQVKVVRRAAVLQGVPGDLLSLFPVHGPAIGVQTEGLRFPLHNEELPVGTSRGVSNEFAAETVRINLRSGALLAVQVSSEATTADR